MELLYDDDVQNRVIMPHQLYISTLPTFTYKEYVDGHRIQCVKPKREEEREWEYSKSNIFVRAFKNIPSMKFKVHRKNNIVEKLYTKSNNPWVYNKKWKAGTQLLIVYFKKRYNKKLKI